MVIKVKRASTSRGSGEEPHGDAEPAPRPKLSRKSLESLQDSGDAPVPSNTTCFQVVDPACPETSSMLLPKVAAALEKLMDSLEGTAEISSQVKASAFHGLRPPPITLVDYLQRIAHYTKCSPACFVAAIAYLDWIYQRDPSMAPCPLSIHRLMLVGSLLATKLLDDKRHSNAFWARVGGVPLPELNALELRMMSMLDHRLLVTPEVLRRYIRQLQTGTLVLGYEPASEAVGRKRRSTGGYSSCGMSAGSEHRKNSRRDGSCYSGHGPAVSGADCSMGSVGRVSSGHRSAGGHPSSGGHHSVGHPSMSGGHPSAGCHSSGGGQVSLAHPRPSVSIGHPSTGCHSSGGGGQPSGGQPSGGYPVSGSERQLSYGDGPAEQEHPGEPYSRQASFCSVGLMRQNSIVHDAGHDVGHDAMSMGSVGVSTGRGSVAGQGSSVEDGDDDMATDSEGPSREVVEQGAAGPEEELVARQGSASGRRQRRHHRHQQRPGTPGTTALSEGEGSGHGAGCVARGRRGTTAARRPALSAASGMHASAARWTEEEEEEDVGTGGIGGTAPTNVQPPAVLAVRSVSASGPRPKAPHALRRVSWADAKRGAGNAGVRDMEH